MKLLLLVGESDVASVLHMGEWLPLRRVILSGAGLSIRFYCSWNPRPLQV
jgi:hypothetical protein